MAQHDYSIANQGFPATRADINNVLSAIATNNSGTSAPSTQYAGQFWIDTTSSTWTLYIHDGSDDIQFATIDTSANTVNFIDSALASDVVINTSGDITTTGAFTSVGIDDNADATAITIDSSEQVGIGTASPGTALQVEKDWVSDYGSINISHSTNSLGGLGIRCNGVFKSALIYKGGTSGALLDIGTYNAEPILFRTSNSERMRIASNGDVYIGASSFTSGTRVKQFEINAATIDLKSGSTSTALQFHQEFCNPNGTVGSITTNGSATAFTTISDYRLKENVNYDFDATTRLKQLKPARFNFIADSDTIVDGFLAHEVQPIVPEAITGTKDAIDEDGNPVYQGIDQAKLVPLLVKTIQELEARITALENA